jgi:hypothetical protein
LRAGEREIYEMLEKRQKTEACRVGGVILMWDFLDLKFELNLKLENFEINFWFQFDKILNF